MKNLEIKISKLENGLRFIEIPFKQSGAISVLVLAKAGSRFENKKVWGIAHFMEHMFFKGGKKYKNTKEISEVIDGVGGSFNASTSKEEVAFFIKLPGDKVDLALDILSDMLISPTFKTEDMEREKNVVIEEMKMYEDTPMSQIGAEFEYLLYGKDPLGQKTIGEKETVSGITRKDLLFYLKNYYFSGNLVVILAGDTSSFSKDKLKKYFSNKRKKALVKTKTPKIFQKSPGLLIRDKETEQSHLSLGFHFPEAAHDNKDYFVSRILSVILGEGMSSRVFLSVREKLGLAYRISSFMESFIDTGYLEVSAGVDNKKLEKSIKAILLEFKKIKGKPISEKELNKAKEYLKGRLILSLEDSLEAAFFVGKQELLIGKIKNILDIFKKVDKVTPKDIMRLAKKNFINSKLNLAIIGPVKDKSSFLNILTVD